MLFSFTAYATDLPDLHYYIQQQFVGEKLVGLAVGITKDGNAILAEGFGTARLGTDNPVTAKSIFHTASLTKSFVATAILQLVEHRELDLDEPVVRYLPYFRLDDKRYAAITIRQILNHTSGIPDVKSDEDYQWDKPEYDDKALERYVRSLNHLRLVAAPGDKFLYSSIAYEILGDVIAKVSGQSFEDYIATAILKPMEMKYSTLLLHKTDPDLLVSPHIRNDKGEPEVSKIYPYNRAHAPSSTLYSNVEDLNRWAIANLNLGELEGKRILKAESYKLLWSPSAKVGPINGEATDISSGFGWFLWDSNQHPIVENTGSDIGFRADILLAPADRVSVVVLSNDSRFSAVRRIAKDILRMLIEKK